MVGRSSRGFGRPPGKVGQPPARQRVAANGAPMYSVNVPIKVGGGDVMWHQVGVAFAGGGKGGKMIKVKLNSVPVGDWDGEFFLFPMEEG